MIVPVQLGCCHEDVRCRLCAPAPKLPDATLIEALVDHYSQKRGADERQPFWVSFFGGPPPSNDMVAACGGLGFSVRVRPDLLSRKRAQELVALGAVGFELDALTFNDRILKEMGRRYSSGRVLEMAKGLRQLGVPVGVVLAPGLPASDFAACVRDARTASTHFDTARIHPVLVYANARLREMHMDGTYTPLTMGETITVTLAMMEALESQGVEVIRVGVQAGPDGAGRPVAGPRHSSLRELVESRRALTAINEQMLGVPVGAAIEILCHPSDETRTRGPLNQNVRTLRANHSLAELRVKSDKTIQRGQWVVKVVE